MKKSLVVLLVIASIAIPAFKNRDTFIEQNSKILVINESIDTFNTEFFYKIEC